MTQTPSSGAGATPATDPTPATGNTSGGATPPKTATTLEEALSRIAELERHAQNKTEEASRHGTRLTAAEKELAAYKAAEEQAKAAQMSELEKAQKQAHEMQEQHEALAAELFESRVYQDVSRLFSKFNFIEGISSDLIAEMLLVKDDEIEFENGKPANIEKLLEKLVKAQPGLVKPTEPQQQQRGAPTVPAMNPGRSSITPPGGAIPGRIPRLSDIEWKR